MAFESVLDEVALPPPSYPSRYFRYSSNFFRNLTFQQLNELVMPRLMPPSSLTRHSWRRAVRDSALSPGEPIPHITELAKILRELPHMVAAGFGGVSVEMNLEDGLYTEQWSTAKIRLIANVLINADPIIYAETVYRKMVQLGEDRALSRDVVDSFSTMRVHAPLAGFMSPVSVWKLGRFFDDVLFIDELLDLKFELTFVKAQLHSTLNTVPLILPSCFADMVLDLLDCSDALFSNVLLLDFRTRIADLCYTGRFDSISFMVYEATHYVSYYYPGFGVLYVGDPLHDEESPFRCSALNLIAHGLNILLAGVTGIQRISSLEYLDVKPEDRRVQCNAVSAFRIVERRIWLGCFPFSPNTVSPDESGWIQDILAHHRQAERCQFKYGRPVWYKDDPPTSLDRPGVETAAYRSGNWNLFTIDKSNAMFGSPSPRTVTQDDFNTFLNGFKPSSGGGYAGNRSPEPGCPSLWFTVNPSDVLFDSPESYDPITDFLEIKTGEGDGDDDLEDNNVN